jgi:hypothetical protein
MDASSRNAIDNRKDIFERKKYPTNAKGKKAKTNRKVLNSIYKSIASLNFK